MRTSPRSVRLDFAAPVHPPRLAGATLCAAGLAAALAVGVAFDRKLAERSQLDAELAATAPPRRAAPDPSAARNAADAAAIERELGIPWIRLLAELEAASQDSASTVSLLAVAPDPGKHLVRITAEVRALNDAIAYLKRLQRSAVLRHPMLESHERRKDDPEHPLRVTLSAEWRT
ncbi:MAG TPA: hypothetical protein VF841_20635 [Anaeromyxobacter sp.]